MRFLDEIKKKFNIEEYIGHRILIVANSGVRVEGHRGICQISDDIIKIKIKNASISIEGKNLIIREISDSEVYISGLIKGVFL